MRLGRIEKEADLGGFSCKDIDGLEGNCRRSQECCVVCRCNNNTVAVVVVEDKLLCFEKSTVHCDAEEKHGHWSALGHSARISEDWMSFRTIARWLREMVLEEPLCELADSLWSNSLDGLED